MRDYGICSWGRKKERLDGFAYERLLSFAIVGKRRKRSEWIGCHRQVESRAWGTCDFRLLVQLTFVEGWRDWKGIGRESKSKDKRRSPRKKRKRKRKKEVKTLSFQWLLWWGVTGQWGVKELKNKRVKECINVQDPSIPSIPITRKGDDRRILTTNQSSFYTLGLHLVRWLTTLFPSGCRVLIILSFQSLYRVHVYLHDTYINITHVRSI